MLRRSALDLSLLSRDKARVVPVVLLCLLYTHARGEVVDTPGDAVSKVKGLSSAENALDRRSEESVTFGTSPKVTRSIQEARSFRVNKDAITVALSTSTPRERARLEVTPATERVNTDTGPTPPCDQCDEQPCVETATCRFAGSAEQEAGLTNRLMLSEETYGFMFFGYHSYLELIMSDFGNQSPKTYALLVIFGLVVLPACLFVVGVTGNILSCFILVHSGLSSSPSNILLFALAITDTMVVVSSCDVFQILNWYGRSDSSVPLFTDTRWQFSYNVAYSMFVGNQLLVFLKSVGITCSAYFTVLITAERLVAVFVPLRFSSLVTARRVVVTFASVSVPIVVYCGYLSAWKQFGYSWNLQYYWNAKGVKKYGFRAWSKHFRDNFDILWVMHTLVNNNVTKTAPLIFVTLGSLLIGLKVRASQQQRLKMTNTASGHGRAKASFSHKTTVTVLLVCVIFILCQSAIVGMRATWVNRFGVTRYHSSMRHYIVAADALNSSLNFFTYVFSNKKFRGVFKDMFPCFRRSN